MKLYKKTLSLILVCALTLSVCACKKSDNHNDTLNIVATNFVSYDFAREIAGEHAQITMLLSPGEESHTYEPTPKDIIKVKNADIFISVGGKSDEWVGRLIETNEIDEKSIIFMMELPEIKNIAEHTHKGGHSEFYEYDEHIWTSIKNVKIIAAKIADIASQLDGQNSNLYEKNLARYLSELDALDKEFFKIAENSQQKTLVFGDRFPFRHFADSYGLTFYSAFPGCSHETEPDAKTVKELIDVVKSKSIPVVLHKELSSEKVCDAICEATGAKKMLLHSLGTISKEDFKNGESYLSLMKKNTYTLKEALK